MRTSVVCVLWVSTVFGFIGSVRADIEYHFKPGVEGQVRGIRSIRASCSRALAPTISRCC